MKLKEIRKLKAIIQIQNKLKVIMKEKELEVVLKKKKLKVKMKEGELEVVIKKKKLKVEIKENKLIKTTLMKIIVILILILFQIMIL